MHFLKTETKKTSTTLHNSKSQADRYIRDRRELDTPSKKISGKGNVMSRMKLFANHSKSQPNLSNQLTSRQIIKRTNKYAHRLNTKPRRDFQIQSLFEIKSFYTEPFPQLLDWGSENIVIIASKQGFELSNLDNYYKFHNLNSGGSTQSIKFHHEGLVAAIGDNKGLIRLYDVDRESRIRKIVPTENYRSPISSILWNKNIVISSSSSAITGEDVSLKKSQIFKVKNHPNIDITSTSFYQNQLAVGYKNGFASIFDIRTLNILHQKNFEQHGYNFVEWCPWKFNLLACGINNSLKMLGGSQLKVKDSCSTKQMITGLITIPGSKEVVVSSADPNGQVHIKTEHLNMVKQFKEHKSPIINLSFNKKQNTISAISCDKQGISWKINQIFPQGKPQKKSLNLRVR